MGPWRVEDIPLDSGLLPAMCSRRSATPSSSVVGEAPDAGGARRRRGNVVEPEGAVGNGELVDEDRRAIEDAIAVGVLDHADEVGAGGVELSIVPVEAGALGEEEAAALVEAAHHGVANQRSLGCGSDGEAFGNREGGGVAGVEGRRQK